MISKWTTGCPILSPFRAGAPAPGDYPPRPTSELVASGHLLHGPAVAVRVVEEDERAPVKLLDLTDVDPASDELRTRRVYVRDHQLQALDGARRHVPEPG